MPEWRPRMRPAQRQRTRRAGQLSRSSVPSRPSSAHSRSDRSQSIPSSSLWRTRRGQPRSLPAAWRMTLWPSVLTRRNSPGKDGVGSGQRLGLAPALPGHFDQRLELPSQELVIGRVVIVGALAHEGVEYVSGLVVLQAPEPADLNDLVCAPRIVPPHRTLPAFDHDLEFVDSEVPELVERDSVLGCSNEPVSEVSPRRIRADSSFLAASRTFFFTAAGFVAPHASITLLNR